MVEATKRKADILEDQISSCFLLPLRLGLLLRKLESICSYIALLNFKNYMRRLLKRRSLKNSSLCMRSTLLQGPIEEVQLHASSMRIKSVAPSRAELARGPQTEAGELKSLAMAPTQTLQTVVQVD